MTLKRSLAGKGAALPRRSNYAKQFLKDWNRLQHSGINLAALKEAMLLLIANDGPLPPEWRDHELKGPLAGYRECHAGGDLLLMYELHGDFVNFARAGSHRDLFRE
jgi:mRNA interferase YafQ